MHATQPPLLIVIRRQVAALEALTRHGEDVFGRMRARLANPSTEIEALPTLFVRYGVQQLMAAHTLAARGTLASAAPQARSLYEATVNLKYLDQDPTGTRKAAYVAYSIAVAEAEAEALVPGTTSAHLRMPHWTAAVGHMQAEDTTVLQQELRASRALERPALVAKHLEDLRRTVTDRIGNSDWGSVVGHGNVLERAKALPDAEHYVGLYRLVYKVLSREAHANNVLDGMAVTETGHAQLLDIHSELPAKTAAVADAVTGVGLSLLSHAAEAHLPDDHDLAETTRQIRQLKKGL